MFAVFAGIDFGKIFELEIRGYTLEGNDCPDISRNKMAHKNMANSVLTLTLGLLLSCERLYPFYSD
jgi:hypothetical protein